MKTKLILSLVMAASILLPSCELGLDFLNPAGKTKTSERPIVGKVAKLVIKDDVDVTVYVNSSTTQRAAVTAGENLISGIKTDFADSTITIKNTNTLAWTSSFKNKKEVTLYLNSPFAELDYYGVGNINVVDTLITDSFTYYCSNSAGEVSIKLKVNSVNVNQQSGVSDLRVYGNGGTATVNYRGTGWIYMDQFVVNNMNITNHGSGDSYVNVLNNLSVKIESIGNVIYKGNPSISLIKEGTGNLIQQ